MCLVTAFFDPRTADIAAQAAPDGSTCHVFGHPDHCRCAAGSVRPSSPSSPVMIEDNSEKTLVTDRHASALPWFGPGGELGGYGLGAWTSRNTLAD